MKHMSTSLIDVTYGMTTTDGPLVYGRTSHFLNRTLYDSKFMDDVLKEGIKLLKEVNE